MHEVQKDFSRSRSLAHSRDPPQHETHCCVKTDLRHVTSGNDIYCTTTQQTVLLEGFCIVCNITPGSSHNVSASDGLECPVTLIARADIKSEMKTTEKACSVERTFFFPKK